MRLLLAVCVVLLPLTQSWPAEWESFTYSNDVFDVKVEGGTVLCATSGGLLEFDLSSRTFTKFTNVDGLLECPCVGAEIDYLGNWWVAHATKGVTVISPDRRVRNFTRYEGILGDTLCCIRAMGNLTMVGTDDGVWSVDTQGDPFGQPLSYRFYLEDRLIRAIFAGDSVVWYGTSDGLFGAYLSAPWDTVYHYTANDGLPGSTVTSVAESGGLWVGTDNGAAVWDGATWVDSSSGLPAKDVKDLAFQNDTLWAATAGGTAFLSGASWMTRNAGLPSWETTSLGAGSGSPLWCGMVHGCIAEYSGTWRGYSSQGLLSNKIEGVGVEEDGDVWVAYAPGGFGVSRLSDGAWKHFNSDTLEVLTRPFKDVLVDRLGSVWFATWGGGLVERTALGGWQVFADTNGFLPTPYVSAVDADRSNNLWIASYFYGGQYGITALSSDRSRVELYDRSSLLVIEDIAIDSTPEEKKWFASHEMGLHVLDDGGTPFDQSDDKWRSYQEPDLPSDEVRAVTVDKDGDVWVSTTGGVVRIRRDEVAEYYYSSPGSLPSSLVYQMIPDWEGGVWFEHEYGITRKNPSGTWSNYSTASGLVSDEITYLLSCLDFDTKTGVLLVGTGGGLSRFHTDLIPRASPDSIDVYPNPFVPGKGHLRVTFKGVPDGSVLRVYTMSGELVIETDRVVNGFAYWDGRNSRGDPVASGIYIFAVGQKKRGAIALVR